MLSDHQLRDRQRALAALVVAATMDAADAIPALEKTAPHVTRSATPIMEAALARARGRV